MSADNDATRSCAPVAGSRILEWLANGRVGSSSKTMAMIALGQKPRDVSHPWDPDDLNRCLLLLRDAPEVRDAFPKIATASKVWARLIARWDDIERMFLDEVGLNWSNGGSAPKTYALMKSVISSANTEPSNSGQESTK